MLLPRHDNAAGVWNLGVDLQIRRAGRSTRAALMRAAASQHQWISYDEAADRELLAGS